VGAEVSHKSMNLLLDLAGISYWVQQQTTVFILQSRGETSSAVAKIEGLLLRNLIEVDIRAVENVLIILISV